MRERGLRTSSVAGMALVAIGLGACGSKSSSQMDPVSTAMQTPGVRTVVIPKQHGDMTIAVPPCSEAQVAQSGSSKIPPGSNQIVVPQGTLTQTVALQPCMQQSSSSSGAFSGGSSGGS